MEKINTRTRHSEFCILLAAPVVTCSSYRDRDERK